MPCNAHLSIIALREPDLELIKANILTKIRNDYTVDSRYLEFQGLFEILQDICTSTYQICKIGGKTNLINHI